MPGGNGESLKDGFLSKPTTANRIICNTHYTAHNYIYIPLQTTIIQLLMFKFLFLAMLILICQQCRVEITATRCFLYSFIYFKADLRMFF